MNYGFSNKQIADKKFLSLYKNGKISTNLALKNFAQFAKNSTIHAK